MLSRKAIYSWIVLLGLPAIALGDSSFPINQAVNVQRQGDLFPYGSVDSYGRVVGDPLSDRTGTFRAGIFGLQYDPPPAGGAYTPFQAICIDANENLFSGTQLYYVQSLANYPSFGPTTDGPAPALTATRKGLLEQLFTAAWNSAQTSALNSAAFQWAAWEIGREEVPPNSLTLTNGEIYTTDAAVRNKANEYLNLITASTAHSSLLIWTPVTLLTDGTYQRVGGQELLTFAPVPEPQFLAIPLMAGLGLLIFRRRRATSIAA